MKDGQQDRSDPEEPSPRPHRRTTRTDWVWPVLRGVLTVTSLVAEAEQHEALAWTARALAVLGIIAVKLRQSTRR